MYPYFYYAGFRQKDMMTASIKNYPKFLSNLKEAINDEASAIRFYKELIDIAPDERQRSSIKHAHDDEIKHFRMFSSLYRRLTGQDAAVHVKETDFADYKEGIHLAFDRELEAAELYRDMILASLNREVHDIFFEAMTDEMEHADRFSFIHHQL